MYFQEDTILRMIEQLGAAYRQLMRLLNDHEAEDELEQLVRRLTGMDRATAKGLAVSTLADMLPNDRRLALSELMLMEAERFAHRMENEEILAEKQRALMLLCTIEDEEIAKLRAERARKLFDECAELCTAADTAAALRFLTLGGAYADAEDVLFMQLHSYARAEDIQLLAEEGDALYDGLLRMTDEQLAAGNLPREEVLQGRASLAAWRRGEGGSAP
jgi:hypothetical protein